MNGSEPILVADDNDTDIHLLRLAFQKAGIPNEFVTARDGQEAVDYLVGALERDGARRNLMPALLILDLNMPRMNGFDVLIWMNAQPQFGELPVVMLTSSPLEEDRLKAGDLGADEYLVKPMGLTELVRMASALGERWLAVLNDED
jgi:CheY-like chemotaxis protein